MTVTYSLDVSSSSFLCLNKLLWRWKGSIWKSVWFELLIWLFFYGILSVVYRTALGDYQREIFEDLCIFFDTYSGFIPITFMLGFYVSAVFSRWEKIFNNIGWIDTPGLMVTTYIQGEKPNDEGARMIRRNCLRYMVLTQALVFRDVSTAVRKRFPTLNHLVTAGLMTETELQYFEKIVTPCYSKYWPTMNWLFYNVRLARKKGYIESDIILTDLMECLRNFRSQITNLSLFDWVPVPLVYTQVVHLAVRSFFLIALFGRQYLNPARGMDELGVKKTIDLYVPIMSILQFTFFVGWMKVAEVLLNPLGEDDDDFETNYILDRNLNVGLKMVDEFNNECPPFEKDQFWGDENVEPLYTVESAVRTPNPQMGSCSNMGLTEEDRYMLRCRRGTLATRSDLDDIDERDVIPVQGLKSQRSMSLMGSRESMQGFSSSILGQSRKLSNMLKRVKNGRRSSGMLAAIKRKDSEMSNIAVFPRHQSTLDVPNHANGWHSNHESRRPSEDSIDLKYDASFHNKAPAPPIPRKSSSGTGRLVFPADNLIPERPPISPERSPTTSPTPHSSWHDSMLPVIEEESLRKKRRNGTTETVSTAGSSPNSSQQSSRHDSHENVHEPQRLKLPDMKRK